MKKTEMMIEFEQETGKQSAILKFITGGQALEQKSYPKLGPYDYNMDYIAWLESKAAAYDRLMSRGKHDITLKELANILNMIIVANKEGRLIAFDRVPTKSNWGGWYAQDVYCVYWGVPLPYKGYDKDWENSLTMPDGWEER